MKHYSIVRQLDANELHPPIGLPGLRGFPLFETRDGKAVKRAHEDPIVTGMGSLEDGERPLGIEFGLGHVPHNTHMGCPDSEERSNVIKAVLALSYVLAQLGNYFLYLLMLYAAYEYKEPLTTTEELLLPLWSLLSGLGSPTAMVDGVIFIGHWLHLPAELTDLFLETWTVTRYGQVVLSVVGFGFATTLVPLIYFGKVRLRHLVATAFRELDLGAQAMGPRMVRPVRAGPR